MNTYLSFGRALLVTLALPELNDGLVWDTNGLFTTGELAVVPEPAGAALLALGAL